MTSHAPSLFLKGGGELILLCDSRQQANKHKNIEEYCKRHDIEMVRQKLPVGDYMLPDGKVSIDTKQDL
jgi:hypothetical protein